MKNVQFLDKQEEVDVDLMIVLDPWMREKLDRILQGAVSFNLQREQENVWMTTNGLYPVPKLLFGKTIPEKIREKTIAIACGDLDAAKLAFDFLLKHPSVETLILLCSQAKESQVCFETEYLPLLEAIKNAKALISAPSNLMTPALFANRCRTLIEQGVEVEIFEEQKLKEIGAEALLAVGKGSIHPPRLVVMHYKGSSKPPIALVGKGVCFDAGGIHLKSAHLNEMKWDKAGAGVVFGAMDALSRMRLPINVVGVVCLAENMPDGGALKPGDVISTLKGITVEIVDTDCEGRLVLADGIAYVENRFKPQIVIDLGTLTLETFGALGGRYAGLFCNDITLSKKLMEAGEKVEERVWSLPLGEYYKNHLSSSVADVKNAGIERYGASSAAAEFLRLFINPQTTWAHIDIAGVSWNLQDPSQGVSGFGVRLLVETLKNLVDS